MKNKNLIYKLSIAITAGSTSTYLWAQADKAVAPVTTSGMVLDSNILLLAIAICLLLPIYILGKVFIMATRIYNEKERNIKISSGLKMLLPFALLLSSPYMLYAQTAAVAVSSAAPATTSGSNWVLYLLLGTILLEAFIIIAYSFQIVKLLKGPVAQHSDSLAPARRPKSAFMNWWEKINSFRPIEEEALLDAGHDYDGIRELNNVTPPWFLFGFALSILFAIGYMWRYHVVQSAPLQIEEFRNEMAAAEEAKDAFLKKQSNNVDENSVKMLGDADIAAGKKLFAASCVACHAANGASIPGGVGPNLTDNYWIHGGQIQDVFKTIKYGYPDKGMKSWKDDFSPNQIAQLASYVESLKGTNIAGGKEPQGEPATEKPVATDTTALDSLKTK